nr:MAG TPA: hypothetical protein [Caudoviricetes sp.]
MTFGEALWRYLQDHRRGYRAVLHCSNETAFW